MALLITAAWNGYELKIEILISFKAKVWVFFFSLETIQLHFQCVCQDWRGLQPTVKQTVQICIFVTVVMSPSMKLMASWEN